MAEKREAFFKAPIRITVATLIRLATKQVPEIGPIQTQAQSQRIIEEILTRRRG